MRISSRVKSIWKRSWMRYAGRQGFGRLASRMAAIGTEPYHGRAVLSFMRPEGFVAHTASVSHVDVRLGKHVYLGDRVTIANGPDPGPVELEDEVQIYGDAFIYTGWRGRIRVGSGTHIQPGSSIYSCICEIDIGRRVEIAPRCAFYSYNHGVALGTVIMDQPLFSKGGIKVGDGAWLGHGVIVLNGVTIGSGAVIGSGSIVVGDIPENAIAVGNPARVLKYRS
jgi:acetyltransferase-like isoleucine patch superfamily enzyme